MLAPVLLSLLGAMLLGALLLILGLRGKRLNDHPTCRDCGFDLENIYPASITCPECGSGLRRPKAVRAGQRRRRPIFIAIALFLLITPLLPIGAVAFAAITGSDVNKYKPLGLLLWEARHTDAKNSKAIATQLYDRMLTGKLTADQEDRITNLALDRQENPDIPWDDAWGDLIERAKLDSRLSEDQQQRFLRNILIPHLKPRRRIAPGDPIPIAIDPETRTGGSLQAFATAWLGPVTLDGKPLQRSYPRTRGEEYMWGMMTSGIPVLQIYAMGAKARNWYTNMEPTVVCFTPPPDRAPGPATIHVELLAQAVNYNAGSFTYQNQRPRSDDPKVRKWTLDVPVEFAPADAAVESVPASDELAGKLAKALHPTQVMLQPAGAGDYLSMTFSVEDLPVPVAFDVTCRVGEREYSVGSFTSGTASPTETMYSYGQKGSRSISHEMRGLKGDTIDVILKPRPELAARTTDLTRVYAGEVVIKDIDVQRMQPPMKTTRSTRKTTTSKDKQDSDSDKQDQKKADPEESSWLSKWIFFWP